MTREDILNLFASCDFEDLTEYSFDSQILDQLPSDFEFDWGQGATKAVIIPENENFVIKIPFCGGYVPSEDYLYYSSGSSYDDCDSTLYYNEHANDDDFRNWDYCLGELLNFRLAYSSHVSKIFAETRLVGTVRDYPIYIQRKVEPADTRGFNEATARAKRDYTIVRESCQRTHTWGRIDEDWLLDALEYYGQKFFNRFLNFLYRYHINDLSDNNIGYIKDRPIIFDYSCYNERR